jgi:hypothetical protein
MCEQQRLQVDLIDAVRRLGCQPPRIRAAGRTVSVAAARDGDACRLRLGAGRVDAIGDVVGKVGRQAGIAQAAGKSEPAVGLHRPRRDVVALYARRLPGGAALGDRHLDAACRQLHRQRQADGAAPDDEYLGCDGPACHGPPCE